MKGIILAGGSGTRLYPITEAISKQLMPIYDKPMIFYPLSTLMLAGIKDILVITTEEDQPGFKRLLKNGEAFGVNISYAVQKHPDGLAQAFIIWEEFIKDDSCAMVLGDNIFYGNGFTKMLEGARKNAENGYATIFGNEVRDPERFGIMEIDDNKYVLSVEDKPEHPKSNIAITGLYFYPEGVAKLARNVVPSARGELEITSVNEVYMNMKKLKVEKLGRGMAWFDTGTHDALIETASFVQTIEKRQGLQICCPEEIAFENGWIDKDEVSKIAAKLKKNDYGKFLKDLADDDL